MLVHWDSVLCMCVVVGWVVYGHALIGESVDRGLFGFGVDVFRRVVG